MENAERTEAIRAVKEKNEGITRETGHAPGVYIVTFGCQQNEADSERLRGIAHAMGYIDADAP